MSGSGCGASGTALAIARPGPRPGPTSTVPPSLPLPRNENRRPWRGPAAHSSFMRRVTDQATSCKIGGERGRRKRRGQARTRPNPLSIKINTAFGPRLAMQPPAITIPRDPAAALAFARRIDREADFHLAEGRRELAERLAHLGCEARFRAAGGRA